MFFKNIDKWSKKQLTTASCICYTIYVLFMLVAPIIVICVNYDIFHKVDKVKISGIALILLLIFTFVGVTQIKKLITKLPDITLKQQKVKYSIELIYSLIIPGIIVVALYFFKVNFELAMNTSITCLIFIFVGILEDGLFLKYLSKEHDLRNKAREKNEVEKRCGLV